MTLVGLIGLTALIGYLLQLEVMYRSAVYNRMAAPTALAMSLSGVVLFMLRYQIRRDAGLALDTPDTRIIKIAAGVLTAVVLVTGLPASLFLKQGFEQSLSEAFLGDAKSTAIAFVSILDHGILLASIISDSAPLQRAPDTLNISETDAVARQSLREVTDNFRQSGLSAIDFVGLPRQNVFSVGRPIRAPATTKIALQWPGVTAQLVWSDGFVLVIEKISIVPVIQSAA